MKSLRKETAFYILTVWTMDIYIYGCHTQKAQLQPSEQSTTGQEREGGLRTTVEDRQCLITAEHDGEGNIRK